MGRRNKIRTIMAARLIRSSTRRMRLMMALTTSGWRRPRDSATYLVTALASFSIELRISLVPRDWRSAMHRLAIKSLGQRSHPFRRAEALHPGPGGLSQIPAEGLVHQHPFDLPRQIAIVSGFEQKPVPAVVDDFRIAARPGGHHREPARHGFQARIGI